MSWLNKLPQKIKRVVGVDKKTVPEGLWSKCPACQSVLYRKDLEDNAEVCPKCSYHNRIGARARLAQLLDAEGQFEIGAQRRTFRLASYLSNRRLPSGIGSFSENS